MHCKPSYILVECGDRFPYRSCLPYFVETEVDHAGFELAISSTDDITSSPEMSNYIGIHFRIERNTWNFHISSPREPLSWNDELWPN